jgi:hypothetical protein
MTTENFTKLENSQKRKTALKIVKGVIDFVSPESVFRRQVSFHPRKRTLKFRNQNMNLNNHGEVFLVGDFRDKFFQKLEDLLSTQLPVAVNIDSVFESKDLRNLKSNDLVIFVNPEFWADFPHVVFKSLKEQKASFEELKFIKNFLPGGWHEMLKVFYPARVICLEPYLSSRNLSTSHNEAAEIIRKYNVLEKNNLEFLNLVVKPEEKYFENLTEINLIQPQEVLQSLKQVTDELALGFSHAELKENFNEVLKFARNSNKNHVGVVFMKNPLNVVRESLPFLGEDITLLVLDAQNKYLAVADDFTHKKVYHLALRGDSFKVFSSAEDLVELTEPIFSLPSMIISLT